METTSKSVSSLGTGLVGVRVRLLLERYTYKPTCIRIHLHAETQPETTNERHRHEGADQGRRAGAAPLGEVHIQE